jgi:transcriptional regulator GlxA family with amidase domain
LDQIKGAAEAGLLDGRQATTNAWYGEDLRHRYPRIDVRTSERIVDERSVISAGTTTAFLDLAIYLVDRFGGHDVAVWTAKALSKDKSIESQRPYFLFVGRRDHGDASVLAVQDWLQEHFARELTVQVLSAYAKMSVRSFARRFQDATGLAPMAYVRRLRIEAAKRRLEITDGKVDSIRDDVGYDDTRSFVRAFQATAGVSPSEYRRRFRLAH